MQLRILFLSLICSLFLKTGFCQNKYVTRTGKIDFIALDHPSAAASSQSATIVMDQLSGELNISLLVKSFEFEKAAMQEKFNAKIMETDKYPKTEFKGTITGIAAVNLQKPGTYQVTVKGTLTLHNQSKEVITNGTLVVEEHSVRAQTKFEVNIADYNVSNPGIGNGIVTINVDCKLQAGKI